MNKHIEISHEDYEALVAEVESLRASVADYQLHLGDIVTYGTSAESLHKKLREVLNTNSKQRAALELCLLVLLDFPSDADRDLWLESHYARQVVEEALKP